MKPEQIALFTDEVLAAAAGRFDLDPASLKRLDGFENMVLETSRNGQPRILRLTHSSHRTADQVAAEIHWIDYLAQHEVSVCRPLRSTADSLTEILDLDEGSLVAVLFEKAKGQPVRRDDQTPEMTFNRGKLIGQMQALTRQYSRSRSL